jgi:hypothetical protein
VDVLTRDDVEERKHQFSREQVSVRMLGDEQSDVGSAISENA